MFVCSTRTLGVSDDGQGLVGACVAEGVTLNVPDAHADARFDAGFDKQSGFRTRAVRRAVRACARVR